MKTYLIIIMAITVLILSAVHPPVSAGQDNIVQLDILFMNHGPMQPTIRELSALIQNHAGRVRANWHDYDQPAGKQFMKMKNIQGHIPLLIYINGSSSYRMANREVTFMGFPTGAGPYQFQGQWSMKDLEAVVKGLLSEK